MRHAQHPSWSWRPDVGRLERRLADELRARASPWPDVGAAAVMARGMSGDQREAWAEMHGVSEDELEAIEQGRTRPAAVPRSLLAVLARRAALAHVTAAAYLPVGREQPMLEDTPTRDGR